ncbi:hypothetical protein DM01DRAFT_1038380 [Hesseltinella vesiculosa]|uniref:Uncharacterized protein n=1 Tax=Hesseltinella vesiculosa TaxID=101127 RepID=A0A1X2GIT9_9FUNG|nr:hypothetical protein DM01DRAFT_1038380 [Hesseltinella vesiculosa]
MEKQKSLKRSPYLGSTELIEFTRTRKKPKLAEFVSLYQQDLPGWCAPHFSFSGQELFSLWKRRFSVARAMLGKDSDPNLTQPIGTKIVLATNTSCCSHCRLRSCRLSIICLGDGTAA